MKCNDLFASGKALCLGVFLCTGLVAGAQGNLQIRHLANEQNIVVLDSVKKFYIFPFRTMHQKEGECCYQ